MAFKRHLWPARAGLLSLALLIASVPVGQTLVSAEEPPTEMRTAATPLIVRSDPSFGAAYVGAVPQNASVLTDSEPVGDEAGNIWYRVRLGDLDGWSHTTWTAPEPEPEPEPEPTPVPETRAATGVSSRSAQRPASNSIGDSIAATALGYVGYPYVYGGASPRGFDCSGLIVWVLQQHGISIGRTTYAQVNYGYWVDMNEAQPGDIIFFANTYAPGISHVGIYIGGGQFVDAESERVGVRINSLSSSYWANHFAGIKRIR